jgi:hypothetical protein
MKKSILFGIIAITIVACIAGLMSFSAADGESPYLYVKTFESHNKMVAAKLLVSDGVEILKEVELEMVRPKSYNENILAITSVLNEIRAQGYELISSNSSCSEWVAMTNYIFEKK